MLILSEAGACLTQLQGNTDRDHQEMMQTKREAACHQGAGVTAELALEEGT